MAYFLSTLYIVLFVSREDWIYSGMVRKSNIIGKQTLKVPEAEVM